MSKKKDQKPSKGGEPPTPPETVPPPPPSTIHEAGLASGPSGAVEYGPEIDEATAIARRRAGEDVVVCGEDEDANRILAYRIENAAGAAGRPQFPHRRTGWSKGIASLSPAQPFPEGAHVLRNREPESEQEIMKYYTPDLLARFGSDDLMVAKTARQKLEQKADEYVAHLGRIRSTLPPRFVELQERFYLHDARIVLPGFPWPHAQFLLPFPFGSWAGFSQDPLELEREPGQLSSFVLMLQLDPPPQEFLVLHYRFVVVEKISHHPALYEGSSAPLEWLHDEVDLIPSDDCLTVEHSILFTQGLELSLRFRDFDYAILSPLGQPSREEAIVETNGS